MRIDAGSNHSFLFCCKWWVGRLVKNVVEDENLYIGLGLLLLPKSDQALREAT